jgi:hypothetical protein
MHCNGVLELGCSLRAVYGCFFFEIIYKKYNNFDEHQNFHASKVVPNDKWTIDVIN